MVASRVRIEVGGPAEDFRSNLVFLYGSSRVFQCMLAQVLKNLAESFRTMQDVTLSEFVYLLKTNIPFNWAGPRVTDI